MKTQTKNIPSYDKYVECLQVSISANKAHKAYGSPHLNAKTKEEFEEKLAILSKLFEESFTAARNVAIAANKWRTATLFAAAGWNNETPYIYA